MLKLPKNKDAFASKIILKQIIEIAVLCFNFGKYKKTTKCYFRTRCLMLSSVLNSAQAIQVNIQIVRIFSRLRTLLTEKSELKLEINEIHERLISHDNSITTIFKYVDELIQQKDNPVKRKRIGFKADDF